MPSKRGQLTLFVILAIILVFVIFVYYLWVEPTFYGGSSTQLDFDSCVISATEEAITLLSLTGGVVNPDFYYMYEDERIPYYCYTNEPYKTCTVQRPLIKQFFEEELIEYMDEKVNDCYDDSLSDLQELGYNVTRGNVLLNMTIVPRRINIDIHAPTTIEGQRFTTYRMTYDSEIYDVLFVATSILQYEASYGDASTSQLMLYYPHLVIDKVRRGDATKVYIITDKVSGNKFQFASKSLIWPAGYDNR